MRFYKRSQDDKGWCIHLSNVYADNGRVSLAMDLLKDLEEEFPGDARVIYAQGLLFRDFLGNGLEARRLFEKAYQSDNSHHISACNAALLSRDSQEFQQWHDIYTKTGENDTSFKKASEEKKRAMNAGIPYGQILESISMEYHNASSYGASASYAELALLTGDIEPEREAGFRKIRSHDLRSLDRAEQALRDARFERLPPAERLALKEAIKELNLVAELDPYDPEVQNFLSAWYFLAGEFGPSIQCVDNAIGRGRKNYHRPYHNKSMALMALGKYDQAQDIALQALHMAESGGNPEDIEEIRKYIGTLAQKRTALTNRDFETIASLMVKMANDASEVELNQFSMIGKSMSISQISNYVTKRIGPSTSTNDYISIIAELLSTFSPETTLKVSISLGDRMRMDVSENLLIASLYVASRSEGLMRRNASRFIALSILASWKAETMRLLYRRIVLEPASADPVMMPGLGNIVYQALDDMNADIARFLADQPPISATESARAAETIIPRFRNLSRPPTYLKIILSLPGMVTFEPKKGRILLVLIIITIIVLSLSVGVLKVTGIL